MTDSTSNAPARTLRARQQCPCCGAPCTGTLLERGERCLVCAKARCTTVCRVRADASSPLDLARRGTKRAREPAEQRAPRAFDNSHVATIAPATLAPVGAPDDAELAALGAAREHIVALRRWIVAAPGPDATAREMLGTLLRRELVRLERAVADAGWARAEKQYVAERTRILAELGAIYVAELGVH